MIALIRQGKPKGTVMAPPSKSFSHRELIAGMLSGASTIRGLAFSEDILATLDCASSFGASFERNGNDIVFKEESNNGNPVFDCRESGSTLRFFLPIALMKFSNIVLRGSQRLVARGVGAYESCLSEHGVSFKKSDTEIEVFGTLKPGTYRIDATSSSQYVTGLLFALPLLDGDSNIELVGGLSSKPYVDMTVETLRTFGITIVERPNGYKVPGGQKYKNMDIRVEGDYSNAAFLAAFANLGCDISISGLNPSSSQGDKVYERHFASLKEKGASIDLDDSIDLAPVLFAFASLNKGGRFTGISRLAIKESNRATAMKEELEKAGCRVDLEDDEAMVYPMKDIPSEIEFDAHNDHRIAMALSLFACFSDIKIKGAECVKKSFPNYFEVLKELGMEVLLYE